MLYFCRLNMGKINPLLKEAYEMNKSLYEEGLYTWYTFAQNIFEEMGLDIKDFESSDKPFDKIKFNLKMKLQNQMNKVYKEKNVNKLSSIDGSSKLFLYSKLKSEIEIEKHLLEEPNFKNRQMITKLRVSDHTLEIETGRYKNIPRENRNCKECKDEIDDEYHFFYLIVS